MGKAVGNAVGETVGDAVGKAVGKAVGATVGVAVGKAVGWVVGWAVGYSVGSGVGMAEHDSSPSLPSVQKPPPHSTQDSYPDVDWYLPDGHLMQLVRPIQAW